MNRAWLAFSRYRGQPGGEQNVRCTMAIDDKHPPQDMAAGMPPDDAPQTPDRDRRLFEDWLTVGVMAALALITFGNVMVRYFTSASFAWTEELSTFLMIVLALVGGASAVVREAHIRIEFFAEAGSSTRRRRLAQIGALLVAVVFIAIGVLSVPVVWEQYVYEETSPGIGVPQWWYSVWLPVFSALIAGRALQVFARKMRRVEADGENAG